MRSAASQRGHDVAVRHDHAGIVLEGPEVARAEGRGRVRRCDELADALDGGVDPLGLPRGEGIVEVGDELPLARLVIEVDLGSRRHSDQQVGAAMPVALAALALLAAPGLQQAAAPKRASTSPSW